MARRPSTMRMGPVSLFALVIILCLAVLAVLSATSANAGQEMAHRQAAFTQDDYANEAAGQLLYAAADDAVAQVAADGGTADDAAAALGARADELEAAAVADGGGAGAADAAGADEPGDAGGAAGDGDAAGADSLSPTASPTVAVTVDGRVLSARIQAASGRCLDVRLEVVAGPALSVDSWKTSTLWTEDTTDVLWTG